MSTSVEIIYGTRDPWAPSARRLTEWAVAAAGRHAGGVAIAIRIVTTAESRTLNRQYRGFDRPTNVLSFPISAEAAATEAHVGERPLGDLAICARVVAREASDQKKTLAAHWAHMVVHGTLHLLGYDHEQDADALLMEKREKVLLKRLGFKNPCQVMQHD
jgi:probable rRNA maturation factor